MHKNKKGFTLAELLVVVAIIAVLVAIAIPIFTNQLEKSREATDAANIRSQYAEVMTDGITNGTGDINNDHSKYAAIELKQTKNGWQTTDLGNNLNSLFGTHIEGEGPNKGGIAWVSYDSKKDCAVLHYEGGSESSGGNSGGSSSSGSGTNENPGGESSDNNPSDIGSLITDSAINYPSSAFTGSLGVIYKYSDGNMYVCVHSQEFAAGGSPTDWYQAQFVPLKVNSEILSASDVKSNSYGGKYVESKTGSLKGTLFKDGDNYYICTVSDGGEWVQPPNETNIKTYPAQQDNAYWVKVEFK